MKEVKNIPRVGVGVIVSNEGRILLGKRKGAHGSGHWGFPGGHLEFGESVEACAERELIEEAGIIPTSLQLGPWVNDIMENEKHYITLFALVHTFKGNVQLLEPHKCEVWQWFLPESLPEPLFPPIPSLIKKVGLKKFTQMVLEN